MKIAFVTTQSLAGSTVIGRVLPLAEELAKKHEVHVLIHGQHFSPPYEGGAAAKAVERVHVHETGRDPFTKTSSGKKRFKGIFLILRLKWNAIFAAVKLITLKPDAVIIEKSLPENVLAVWLATRIIHPKTIILDIDDFELTANVTTSWTQRAAIHWAERTGAKLAHHIIAATPLLVDHFEQLTQGKKPITLIPTGLSPLYTPDVYNGVHIGSEMPVLVYAGSISLSSGHRIDLLPDILAEVRREYPKIQLHIYGDGDDTEKLKKMFAEKNIADAVTWHGRFTPLSLRRRGDGSEVLLDPVDSSITARAKSSFRVALAAALGLPVVTSDIGIRPYLLPDSLHTRFFAKPGEARDCAAKVLALIKNPLTENEQSSLQTHAQQYTWQTLGQKYEKIIAA